MEHQKLEYWLIKNRKELKEHNLKEVHSRYNTNEKITELFFLLQNNKYIQYWDNLVLELEDKYSVSIAVDSDTELCGSQWGFDVLEL